MKIMWFENIKHIRGLLLDISGVLYDSGPSGGAAIDGSIKALERLDASGVPYRLCTNESQITRQQIAAKLNRLGFNVEAEKIFPPAPAVRKILEERNLRPHLLVLPDVRGEFEGVDQHDPNCVVMGDAGQDFSYEKLNDAFRVLMSLHQPLLISMGRGKYYKETDGLKLDVGSYAKVLEYACDVKAEVVGKPTPSFFLGALRDMGLTPENALMIGDDVMNDVGGAQRCGMMGLLVRTGKYRPSDEANDEVTPTGIEDDLHQAVHVFLEHNKS